MALQLRPVAINWTDRFTKPDDYEAQIRANLQGPQPLQVQQALNQAPTPGVQQAIQQQQAAAPQIQQPVAQKPQANIWQDVSSFLGADAFNRTGQGIAEVINELNGGAQKERDQKAQSDQQDLALIKHYGTLIRDGDPTTKARAQQALASLMRTSDTQDKSFQERQQQIIDRTDPVKGAAAVGELGLDIATAGVGGQAAKAGIKTVTEGGKLLSTQLAKDAAAGAGIGAAYGAEGTVQQQGAQTNIGDVAKNALLGAGIGGVTPLAGKLLAKGGKFVSSKMSEQDAKIANQLIPDSNTKFKVGVKGTDTLTNNDMADIVATHRKRFGDENVQLGDESRSTTMGSYKYKEDMINLAHGKADLNTFNHESVHKAIGQFLPDREIEQLYKDVVKIRGGKRSLTQQYQEGGYANATWRTAAEEEIANHFVDYLKYGTTLKDANRADKIAVWARDKGLPKSVITVFEKLSSAIDKVYGRNSAEARIGDFYKRVDDGSFNGAPRRDSKYVQPRPVNAVVKDIVADARLKTANNNPFDNFDKALRYKYGEHAGGDKLSIAKPSARLTKGENKQTGTLSSVDANDVFNNRKIITRIRNELGTKFIDSHANMDKLLGRIEKETGRTGLRDQFYYDTGRVRVANAIADHRVTGSKDVVKALQGLGDYTKVGRFIRQNVLKQNGMSDLDRFDNYVGARAELNNYKGLKTSRSKEENAAIVATGDQEFGQRFEALNQFYKEQSQYLQDHGMLSASDNAKNQKSGNYVRIQRNIEDLVQPQLPGSKSISIGSTSTKQRRTGSSREILSPTRSLLERAQQLELEVQRNLAANHTIDVLEQYGLAKRVGDGAMTNTVERFRGGKKEFFQVPGDVVKEMKNLKPASLGVTMQILGGPVRLLRAGATGLNVPFAAANYLKDQVGSAIQSKDVLATHNPFTIIKSLGSAARDLGDGSTDPLWKKFEEFTGNQTIYDELRNQKATNQTLRELRLGQKGRFVNRAISPVRSLEDLIGITEKATRFQNFKGTYTKAIGRNGGDEAAALREATLAARKNTTDFNRAGEWGQVLNGFVPYFNASIQGTRSMARSFKERPISTSMKTIGGVALPTVAATLWNYGDDKRREAYQSINDYEKQDNWIIVGPDARQKSDGSWEGIVKIPKPPGYKDLVDPVRDVTESFAKGQPSVDIARVATDVLNALGGPVKTGSAEQLMGSLIPQQIKPFVQASANKNFYTGKDIVPKFMQNETDDKSKQAYDNTSGTARMLAKQFGVSPITVENFIKDAGASVGLYALNASDELAAKAGVIPSEQIGGKSIVEDVKGRFMRASGNLLEKNKTEGQKFYEARTEATKGLDSNEMSAYNALHPQKKNFLGDQIYDADSVYNAAARLDTYNRFPKVFEADKKLDSIQRGQGKPGNPVYDLQPDQLKKVLEKENLPPGAKDPELSNLYDKEWYVDYQNKKTSYFDYVAKAAKDAGKPLGGSDNPYPTTPENVQKDMDYYNTLPKGTGERSAWIKSNPDNWAAMQAQFAATDDWQNKQRAKRGLDATEGAAGVANGYAAPTSTYGSGSGGSRSSGINPYGFEVKRGGATIKLSSSKAKKRVSLKSTKATTAKPKVSIKKAVA